MRALKILAFLLILNSFILLGFLVSNNTGEIINDNKPEYGNLTYAVDGDTIDVTISNITQRVRLLGINTPEKNEKNYEQAKNYLKQFEGKEIKLEKTIENKDKYGRLLRYVFLNNIFLNKEALENGWAHFYTYNEDKYTQQLRQAEEKARKQELGIWEKSKEQCASCIILAELNKIDPGEYIILENKCEINCNLQEWTINDDSSSHKRKLDFVINAGEQKKIDYSGRIWNDEGDSLYLRDELGKLVVFYRY